MALIAGGLDVTTVAQLIGVPRSTVGNWRRGRAVEYHQRLATANSRWRPSNSAQYPYLLGVYLGDGCLSIGRSGATTLAVSLDSAYPAIVKEVEEAMAAVFPRTSARRVLRKDARVTVVRSSHPALPHAFPQHGVGRKHTRPIELTGWQRELTHANPRELLRGLIHSDGCRCVNRFQTKLPSGRTAEYEYPRYFFSNLSAGIRRIFCEHCALLGIRCTQSNPRNISVSHRKSVALLDEFVGPKT